MHQTQLLELIHELGDGLPAGGRHIGDVLMGQPDLERHCGFGALTMFLREQEQQLPRRRPRS